jgi:endonuclease/exonuclease/phosphatase family metal-dependent hydrolase
MLKIFCLFSVFPVFITTVDAQVLSEKQPAGILFYNVENFFNPSLNKKYDDDEFTPEGARRWTYYRKKRKQNNIARVILNAGKWNPPVLVGLCEVEDRKVLNDLVWETGLHNLGYYIVHFESSDSRGIDVALLYRKDRFKVLNSRPAHVQLYGKQRDTRDILYVCGVLEGTDTLHIMVNHWPSRWGGEGTTRNKRIAAARTLRSLCDSVLAISPFAKIVAMGDFNDAPDDESLMLFSEPFENKEENCMINLGRYFLGPVPGTIKHQYEWSIFDQILVSSWLCPGKVRSGFHIDEMKMNAVDLPFLFEDDPKYPGKRLFRTFVGYKYTGGYSDHLPVMIELKK